MYLKNLTVFGFKSFANKTSLNFQPGVTAIVGPNGCGKSNVSDAIRWVLGEQSAKALRGGEMADVIFNGTDGRKPLGMAEVSLTIGGVDDEHLKAAGVEVSYNEVTVTRRVFRDGGSEYFINKTSCRLKDVQQLFMGTGVGRTSYSIMAQGNITQILSSKPEDRRMIFEEAAGITKFKAQKKESLRKLEYTEQNLLRIADLIREVKRQIGSLQRQAGKARRYKQLMQELQHLDTQLARHQFDVLQTEISERQALTEKLRNDIEIASAEVLRKEDEIVQLRQQLSTLEHQISEMQQRGLELRSSIDRQESRIQYNEERLRELAAQNASALAEITEAEERHLVAEQELDVLTDRLSASTATLEQHRASLQSKQDALREVEEELRQRQEALRQAQSQAFSQAQQLTRVRNEINALDLQKQGNVVRLEKLSAEKIQLEEERVQLESRLSEFAANVEMEKLNVQTQRGTVEERQARLKQIQQELTQLTQELDAYLQKQAEKRSRLNVLQQLQSEHEGFSAGALAALKKADQVLGSLADKIRVPDQYITAVETALGHYLQVVITESPEAAQQILTDLSNNKQGRASIASLALGLNAPVAATPPSAHMAALSVIEADASVQHFLHSVLGQTLIVPDLQTATAAWQENQGAFDFVTLSGELLNRHGVYTGGSAQSSGKAPSSILGRKNQIAELETHISQAQEQVNELSRRKGALLSEQTSLQAGLQQAQTELRQQEVAIATRQGEYNALQISQRVLHQKIDTVIYEIESLASQEEEGSQKRAALATQISELESRERSLQEEVAQLTASLEELRQQRDGATTGLTETKVALASEEQICSSFRQQQQSLTQRIRELARLVEQRRSEVSSFLNRKTQAESEIQESRRQIESLQIDRSQLNAQVADLVGQKETLELDIISRDDDLKEQRRRLSGAQQQRGSIEVELAQKNMSVQNLRERIQQKYHLNLDEIRSECITITIAEEGPAKVETLTPEEMAASGAATDWNAIAEQVAGLQKRLDEMGPVNLVAIEEYEETEQRFNFLNTQHDDLVKAKAELMEIINRINGQTREMFTQTFEKIRDNFRAMFTEVFGGGKADLILTGEGDALESGIDIVARPPGKQLQQISLLSGGEQTMTAVSLLFSIYQVKPSPFCVLDELDAPLDESNINRFIRVLQRFLSHSQFIIITHNKRTIGMADVLYGVTMEEHGISKIVSVKFHKADEVVVDHKPMPLVPPATGGTSVDKVEDSSHKREETIDIAMAE
ncbi:chromosome segregation protein SMC [Pedosphaera parvula]|uniref:Chromosome partition protein Smc n=1 Tax=Pedosphaera parvula (strain Ellin514) TaxID=320771 RepID=B9XDT2_PEDPL|nr:chromosome segregation protein SMC [Pedosphaera parvula]EEF61823.1 chromosome segregation protein SMC [Pedosphaera parvula Ellin514]